MKTTPSSALEVESQIASIHLFFRKPIAQAIVCLQKYREHNRISTWIEFYSDTVEKLQ